MGRVTRKTKVAEDTQTKIEKRSPAKEKQQQQSGPSSSRGLIRCRPIGALIDDDSNFMDNQVKFHFEENSISQPFVEVLPVINDPVQPEECCIIDAVSISSESEASHRRDEPPKPDPPAVEPKKEEEVIGDGPLIPSTPSGRQNRKFALKGNYRKVTEFFSATPIRHTPATIPLGKENKEVEIKTDKTPNLPIAATPGGIVQYADSKSRNPVTRFQIKRKLCRSTDLRMVSRKYHEENQTSLNRFYNSTGEGCSYYKTYESSRFPVTISGDIDIERFVEILQESDADSRLRIKIEPGQNCIILEPTEILEAEPEDLLINDIRNVLTRVDGYSVEEKHVEEDPGKTEVEEEKAEKALDTISISSSLSDPNDTEYVPEVEEEDLPKKGVKRNKAKTPGKTKAIKTAKPKRTREKPVCPGYKIVKGTTFAVDAFRYGSIDGVTNYFLTHFHSDHYVGLTKKFSHTIYMSKVTANLVRKILKVEDRFIVEVALNVPVIVDDVEVTAIDANHCPGAVMFIFKLPSSECILHVGDFRASPEMETEPIFWNNHISCIYLDTTYLTVKYDHPTQMESIDRMLGYVKEYQEQNIGVKYVIVVGTYVIGKEKVWSALARQLGSKVWLEKSRLAAVECYEDPSLLELIEVDPTKALIHVLPLQNVVYENMVEYLSQFEDVFTHALAIRPSGWERNTKPRRRGQITILGVQYSEHSCYSELERFVRYLQPEEAISTVPLGSDHTKVPRIPTKWLKKDVKPLRKGQQTITTFLKVKRPISSSQEMMDVSDCGTNLTNLSMQIHAIESVTDTDWLD